MDIPKSPVHAMRRSTRLRVEMPVRIRSLDPKFAFEAECRTLIINSQGCGIQSPKELPKDTIVLLSVGERQTTGVVLNSTAVGSSTNNWVVGIELHESGNIWGLPDPPADWVHIPAAAEAVTAPAAPAVEAAPSATKGKAWPFAKKRSVKAAPPAPAVPQKPAVDVAAAAAPAPAPASAQDELLGRLRQELDTRLSEQWEQWRAQAQTNLTEIQAELRKQLDAGMEHWRGETRRAEEKLAELVQLRDDIEARSKAVTEDLAAQLAAGRQHLLSELKTLAGEVHGTAAEASNKAAEIARAQAEISATAQQVSASVDSQVRAAAEAAIARLTSESQSRLDAALASGLEQLQHQIRGMGQEGDSGLRQRLLEEFDRREKEFLATISERVQDVSSARAAIRDFADQVTAELLRQSEQSMAGLRSDVEQMIARHEAEVASKLAESERRLQEDAARREAELDAAADRALQAIEERQNSAAVAREAQLTAAANSALESIDARRAQLESELEQRSWDYDAQSQVSNERLQQRLAEALEKLHRQAEEREAQIQSALEERLRAAEISHRTDLQAESDRHMAGFRERLGSEFDQRGRDLQEKQDAIASALNTLQAGQQELTANFQKIQEAKAYIESVVASLPSTIAEHARQHAAEAAANAWNGLRADSEKLMAETLRQESQREAQQVREMLGVAARQLREEMASQAQKSAADLQARFVEVIAERERALEATVQASAAAAEERMRGAEMQSGSDFERRLAALFENERRISQEQFEKSRTTAEQLFINVAQRSDRLLNELHAGLQHQAKDLVDQELARAKREMQSGSAAVRDQELALMREELERVAADQVNRAVTAAAEATGSAEQLKVSIAQTEAQSQALQQQLEAARSWLAQESDAFQQNVHDAFLKASGEIRGRAHAAIEMADEFIQQKARETLDRVDAASAGQGEKLQRQAAEAEARLQQLETAAAAKAEAVLQARLAETLDMFRQDASRLAESAILRWQAAMEETLRAMPTVLRHHLEQDTEERPSAQGAVAGDKFHHQAG